MVGIVVGLGEHRRDTDRHRCAGEGFGEIPLAAGRSTTPARLLAGLTALGEALKARKPKQAKDILASLQVLSWPAGSRTDLDRLATLIARYRYPEAFRLTETLARTFHVGEEA